MKHVPCYLCGSDDPVVIDDKFEHPDPYLDLINKLYSKSKNTSIENKKLQGKVTNTFVKGEELFKLQ